MKVKGEKSLAVSKIQLSIVVVAEEPWWEVRGAGAGGGPRQGPGLRRRGRLHGVHPAVSTEYTYMEYTVLKYSINLYSGTRTHSQINHLRSSRYSKLFKYHLKKISSQNWINIKMNFIEILQNFDFAKIFIY